MPTTTLARETDLLAMLLDQMQRDGLTDMIARGDKFTVDQVSCPLAQIATDYVRSYRGSFDFLRDVQANLRPGRLLTPGQAKAALNCMLAEVRRSAARGAEVAPVASDLHPIEDGYYTVVSDDGHVTLRVTTAKSGRYQNVAFLYGSDNTSDYRTIGGLYGTTFKFWASSTNYKTGETVRINPASYARQQAALTFLLRADGDGRVAAGREYAVKSGNCYRCGRLLTDEVSIAYGIGPTCRGKAAA